MTSVPAKTIRKWADLVERLSYATDKGGMKWEDGSSRGDVLAKIGNFTVSISEVEPDFKVRIFDQQSRLIDEFSDNDISSATNSSAYQILAELHRSAHRQITGADTVLEEIINELPEVPKKSGIKSDHDDEIPF